MIGGTLCKWNGAGWSRQRCWWQRPTLFFLPSAALNRSDKSPVSTSQNKPMCARTPHTPSDIQYFSVKLKQTYAGCALTDLSLITHVEITWWHKNFYFLSFGFTRNKLMNIAPPPRMAAYLWRNIKFWRGCNDTFNNDIMGIMVHSWLYNTGMVWAHLERYDVNGIRWLKINTEMGFFAIKEEKKMPISLQW